MISEKSSIHKNAKIGNNVKIGDFCVIGENVEIGDNCVISANSAVLRSFPDNSKIAGSPARLRSELYRDQAFISRLRKKAQDEEEA